MNGYRLRPTERAVALGLFLLRDQIMRQAQTKLEPVDQALDGLAAELAEREGLGGDAWDFEDGSGGMVLAPRADQEQPEDE